MGRLFLSLSLLPVLGAVQDGEWKIFSPKDGGFTVLMPGMPMEDKQDVKTVGGDISVILHILEVKNEGSLVVSYSEYPDAAFKGGDDDKRLDSARDGAVVSAKGKLKSEKKITLDGRPGRDLHIETSAKGVEGAVRTRIYAVNKRLFQTMVVGTRDFVGGKDAERFLDSFKLAK